MAETREAARFRRALEIARVRNEDVSRISPSRLYILFGLLNRISRAYAHFFFFRGDPSIVAYQEGKYFGLAAVDSIRIAIHSFPFSPVVFASCHSRKGAYYIDEFLL